MPKKDTAREAAEALLEDRLASEDDDLFEGSDEGLDLAGADEPPAGFTPDDYPDDDEDDSDDGIEPDATDADPEADEGDPDDTEGDGTPSDDDLSDDQGEDEGTGEPEEGEGTAESPVMLADDELDTFVRFGDMEQPMTLRELGERLKYADSRELYLKKQQEWSEITKTAQTKLQEAESTLQRKTEHAKVYTAPHLFLDGYVQEMITNGVLPQEAYEDIAGLLQDYAETGRYNAQGVLTDLQTRLTQEAQAAEAAARAEQEYEDNARADVKEIESKYKTKLDKPTLQQIGTYIQEYAAENNGFLLRVRDAYRLLMADGKIVHTPTTPTSKNKVAKRLRRKGNASVPGKAPGAGSAARTQQQKDAEAALRALRGD